MADEQQHLVHPALRPRHKPKRVDKKTRRTIVRVAKLINDSDESRPASLIQIPIEPSHNNAGTLGDPTIPLRHYLEKGYQFPHEFDVEKYPGIYCAVVNCWDWAMVTTDPDNGTERCPEHEVMYRTGEIRYAMSAKGNR